MGSRNNILKFRPKNSFSEYLDDHPDLRDLSLDEQLSHFRTYGVNIQTSSFFREELLLQALKQVILPSYSPDQQIRIASVGCSSGEDLYAVLLSNWDKRDAITLHGYDINPKMIESARQASYPAMGGKDFDRSFKLLCPESAHEAFRIYKDGDYFTVKLKDTARDSVKFEQHNILASPLSQRYDIILLENVLMHFNSRGRRRILKNVNKSLKNNGWLVCEGRSAWGVRDRELYEEWMEFIGETGFKHSEAKVPGWISPSQVYQKSAMYGIPPTNWAMYLLKELKLMTDRIEYRCRN